MAKIIKVDGTVENVEPENGSDFSLSELYRHIDCTTVERLPLQGRQWMWMDEDGKINGSAYNPMASGLWGLYKPAGYADQYIHGNVLICADGEVL